jgi:hypothetical protein
MQEPPVAKSTRSAVKPAPKVQQPSSEDSFSQWLRAEKSVHIDWSTFGIEKLHSQKPH